MENSDAHRVNEGLVLRALVASGASSRQQIVRETELSKATVSRLIRELIDAELVVEGPTISGPDGGRATQTLEFMGAKELVCGIDIGGTNSRFVVADQRANLREAWRTPTIQADSGAAIARWVIDQIHERCPDAHTHGFAATVVGVPGVVVPSTHDVEHVPNLPGMAGSAFFAELQAGMSGQVSIENDSNVALRGEMASGAASGAKDVVMVTLGTGVGAGVALDGRPVPGRHGLVGEFGLLPVELDGTSVEDILSGVVVRAAAASLSDLGSASSTPGSTGDDVQAVTRDRIVGALFALCMAISVAYDPEIIVFGGRVSEQLGPGLDGVRRRMATRLAATPELALSHLGDAAGALGAVASALDTAHQLLGAGGRRIDDHTPLPAMRTLSDAVISRFEKGTQRNVRHGAVAR